MSHTLLIPDETRDRMALYLTSLRNGEGRAGKRLGDNLAGLNLAALTEARFLDALVNTKVLAILAESSVVGDGTDWNLTELRLLGDISIAVPVTVFDNGHHTAPVPHAQPFAGNLIFTPGVLLCNGKGQKPADWAEAVRPRGKLCPDGYYNLYERRLLPVFQHVADTAEAVGKVAFVAIPGLGCGPFAGSFKGQLGPALQVVLKKFLKRHLGKFPCILGVYFDPYDECSNARFGIHGNSFFVRPFLKGKPAKPQLCLPQAYAEEMDVFEDCMLYSIADSDPVSWPGNMYFGGLRCTDDGVKAAATDSMAVISGVEGHYDPVRGAYLPPAPYRMWAEVVRANGLRL